MAPKRSKDTKEAPEPISEMDITNAILEQSQARFDPESLAILQEKLHNVRTLFEKKVKKDGLQNTVRELGRSIDNGTTFEDFGIVDSRRGTTCIGRTRTELAAATSRPHNAISTAQREATSHVSENANKSGDKTLSPSANIRNGINQMVLSSEPMAIDPRLMSPLPSTVAPTQNQQHMRGSPESKSVLQQTCPAKRKAEKLQEAPPSPSSPVPAKRRNHENIDMSVNPSIFHPDPPMTGRRNGLNGPCMLSTTNTGHNGWGATTVLESIEPPDTSLQTQVASRQPVPSQVPDGNDAFKPMRPAPSAPRAKLLEKSTALARLKALEEENARLKGTTARVAKAMKTLGSYGPPMSELEKVMRKIAQNPSEPESIVHVNEMLSYLDSVRDLSVILLEVKTRVESAREGKKTQIGGQSKESTKE